MTGCHYKKCLRATSLSEPSQVPPTVGFQRGNNPSTAPLPWHRNTPAGTASAWGTHTSHLTAGVHGTQFVSTEQEAKQNKTFGSVFCQPTHVKQTLL